MNFTDALVGAVAIGAGVFVLLAGIANWEWFFQLPKARWIENRAGRGGARVFFSLIGFAVILLGLAIAAGLFERRASSRERFGPESSPVALHV